MKIIYVYEGEFEQGRSGNPYVKCNGLYEDPFQNIKDGYKIRVTIEVEG